MAAPQRARITAELTRTPPAVTRLSGPAQHRVRLVDHSGPEPVTLAVISLAEAAALHEQLENALVAHQAAAAEGLC